MAVLLRQVRVRYAFLDYLVYLIGMICWDVAVRCAGLLMRPGATPASLPTSFIMQRHSLSWQLPLPLWTSAKTSRAVETSRSTDRCRPDVLLRNWYWKTSVLLTAPRPSCSEASVVLQELISASSRRPLFPCRSFKSTTRRSSSAMRGRLLPVSEIFSNMQTNHKTCDASRPVLDWARHEHVMSCSSPCAIKAYKQPRCADCLAFAHTVP